MTDRRPIGVFDSGVGGLTVAAALMRRLPAEEILYLGDTARLPYGTKSAQTVRRYTRRNVDFLVRRGVKAVVVACNTASALALENGEYEDAGEALPDEVPVWGVIEPGAAQAVRATRNGRVGVVATESTVRSDAYARAVRRRGEAEGLEVTVESRACPLFVPLVEEGWIDDPVTRQVAERYLAPLMDSGIDTLVLGCTHYPVLRGVLQDLLGDDVTLVDSAESVAAVVADELAARGLLATPPGEPAARLPRHHLCVTDVETRFERIARRLLHHEHSPLEDRVTLELVEV